jgi:hypothetical protein
MISASGNIRSTACALRAEKAQRGVGRGFAVKGALVHARRRRLEGEAEPLE